MVIVYPTGALDLWNLFVVNVFGGFWMAVFGIAALMFIMMGFLGRMSIYSVMMYCLLFLYVMFLGSGYVVFNMLLSIILMVSLAFSISGYLSRGGS